MSQRIELCLIGVPNVGKSLLFGLLTGTDPNSSEVPQSTLRPVLGTAEWKDELTEKVAQKLRPEKVYLPELVIHDTVGMNPDAGDGSKQLYAAHLAQARAANHLLFVLGTFIKPSVSGCEPLLGQYRSLRQILCRCDLASIERELPRVERMVQAKHLPEKTLRVLREAQEAVAKGVCLSTYANLEPPVVSLFEKHGLLTHKRGAILVNMGDDDSPDVESLSPLRKETSQEAFAIKGNLEWEITRMGAEEWELLRDGFGGYRSRKKELWPFLLRALGYVKYYTFGHLGLKVWLLLRGGTALDAAKEMHSDMAKRFAGAEVFSVTDLEEGVDHAALRARGKVRRVNKDYIVQDDDVLYFGTA